jgi:hypothetical protein
MSNQPQTGNNHKVFQLLERHMIVVILERAEFLLFSLLSILEEIRDSASHWGHKRPQ